MTGGADGSDREARTGGGGPYVGMEVAWSRIAGDVNTVPGALGMSFLRVESNPTRSTMNTTLTVGDRAPDFELSGGDGTKVRLSDFLGKSNVVLFFYPKDETSGCTIEACAFRDSHADFIALGAEVIGISGDTVESHKSFADRHHLPMSLVSDPGGVVANRYGVTKMWGLIPGRVTFLIDRGGIVRHITDGRLRFRQHATLALAHLRTLPR